MSESKSTCPFCRGSLIGDYDKGELVCPNCGLVVLDQVADTGPEWKAMDLEEKQKRVRVGSPRTLALHDFGLTTEIGEAKGIAGKERSNGYSQTSIDRMKMWQRMIRTSSSAERGLSNVLARISEFSNNLNLPKSTSETAAHIYRTSAKLRVAKSKSTVGMAAASVYLACRKCGTGRTLKEVAKVARLERGVVAKYYRLILTEVEKNYVPPQPIQKYISKLVNVAHLDTKIERLALKLSSRTQDSRLSSGKAPAGLAGAYIYISSVMLGERISQREVADLAEVTEVTVRNRCREILDSYSVTQKLMPAIPGKG
ncbi:MAG: transcription initiation factor IIB family protein [Nitrososphaerales archaeon]